MRLTRSIAAATLSLCACTGSPEVSEPQGNQSAGPAVHSGADAPSPAPPAASPARPGWNLQASGEGSALVYVPEGGTPSIRLFCPAGGGRLLVNVPAFRPVGSEERLSFGSGGDAAALVADTAGDAQRGGVSGAGAVPANLAALLAGPLSASYGAQTSGPHPAPPANLVQPFAAACYQRLAVPASPPAGSPPGPTGPCMVQGSARLQVAPLRAVGTEPFWGARIEGRCVTYSHPEDQQGTRVWTRYTPGPNGAGTWAGALNGQRFELRTRPQPGCSDGMSDARYPIAVDLLVGGERRRGCAVPL